MSLFGLLSATAGFVKVRFLVDKEVIDNVIFRCHYRITSAILFVCCILCTANSLIGRYLIIHIIMLREPNGIMLTHLMYLIRIPVRDNINPDLFYFSRQMSAYLLKTGHDHFAAAASVFRG
jgi:hypothetical protein